MRTVREVPCIAVCLVSILMTFGSVAAETPDYPAVTESKPSLSGSTVQTQERLIGTWMGEAPLKEGGYRRWLMERRADGVYKLTNRIYPDKTSHSTKEQVEVGDWGVAGAIYFTTMRGWFIEGRFVPSKTSTYYRDAYKIVTLDSEKFEYQNIETGNRFTVRRVNSGFQLPS